MLKLLCFEKRHLKASSSHFFPMLGNCLSFKWHMQKAICFFFSSCKLHVDSKKMLILISSGSIGGRMLLHHYKFTINYLGSAQLLKR